MVQCSRINEDEQAKRKRGERRSVADPTKKTPIVCKRLSEESTASIVESQAGECQSAATRSVLFPAQILKHKAPVLRDGANGRSKMENRGSRTKETRTGLPIVDCHLPIAISLIDKWQSAIHNRQLGSSLCTHQEPACKPCEGFGADGTAPQLESRPVVCAGRAMERPDLESQTLSSL
jgi:hypothetical protein